MKLSLGTYVRDYSVAGGAVSYDADAQAYFTANTSITSDADKNAINDFYLGLKSDGIYTKIKAMYLPIWGSAAACKWNLINNRSFDLTFSTGINYNSTGILSVGGYANTNLNSLNQLTLNSTHLSYYSRTNSDGTQVEMGNITGPPSFILACKLSGSSTSDQYNYNTGRVIVGQPDSKGFFISSRTNSNTHKLFKNAVQIGTTNTGASGTFLNLNIYLLAYNLNGTAGAFSAKECSFSSIGDGLTDAEASNLHSRVNTLMTYFGINV